MALGFHVSSIQEDKEQSQLCSWVRNDTRSDTKSSHLPASQFHEKDVRFTSLSNSRCIFKMTLGPVPYFLTESLFLQWHPRTPRSIRDQDAEKQTPCVTSCNCKPFPILRLRAPFPGPSAEESEGLRLETVGDSARRITDLRKVRSSVCSQHVSQHHLLHFPSTCDTHSHVFPKLWQALGVRGKLAQMDTIQKLIQEARVI